MRRNEWEALHTVFAICSLQTTIYGGVCTGYTAWITSAPGRAGERGSRGEGRPYPHPAPTRYGGSGKSGVPFQEGYRGITAFTKRLQSITQGIRQAVRHEVLALISQVRFLHPLPPA